MGAQQRDRSTIPWHRRLEARVAVALGLLVAASLGALLFIILLPKEYAIYFQLLGGIWIIQTFPALILGLYTRWLDPKALKELRSWKMPVGCGESQR